MPKFNDLTGKTIGRLTFVSHEYIAPKRYWIAKCQCGDLNNYRADSLSRMERAGTTFECVNCKNKRRFPSLEGKIFGRWNVIKEIDRKNIKNRWWLCKCDCGIEKILRSGALLSGKSKSCGCLARKLHSKWANTTQYPPAHGFKSNKRDEITYALYNSRSSMIASCYNPKNDRYITHGAQGNTVCDLWRNGAKDFIKWALENGHKKGDAVFLKEGKTIFNPENCFIMSRSEFRIKYGTYKKMNENKEV